jgi:hypothetical protein
LLLTRDDVHHARDCVRAINGRGALLQHFDAIDHPGGNGVEVNRARHTRSGRAIHPTQTIDQDQSTRRAEITEIDFRCAGANAAAIGRIAKIAGGIEALVQTTAGDRRALQDVGRR